VSTATEPYSPKPQASAILAELMPRHVAILMVGDRRLVQPCGLTGIEGCVRDEAEAIQENRIGHERSPGWPGCC